MEEKTEAIYHNCKSNYKMVLRRFKSIKTTPAGMASVFLPYTKAEVIEMYETAIKRFEDGK